MKRPMKQFWRTLVALVFAAALLSGSLPALAEDGEQSLPDWTGEVPVAGLVARMVILDGRFLGADA